MGTIFTLTNDIKTIAQAAITDLINQLGKQCQLVYPPTVSVCPNCYFDSLNNKSTNIFLPGGPTPFPDGSICPVCSGSGNLATETSTTITMLIANHPSKFFIKIPHIEVPAGAIQTKGFIADLPTVMKAQAMILQPTFPNRLRYVLAGEPIDEGNIIQNQYFVATWKRAG